MMTLDMAYESAKDNALRDGHPSDKSQIDKGDIESDGSFQVHCDIQNLHVHRRGKDKKSEASKGLSSCISCIKRPICSHKSSS